VSASTVLSATVHRHDDSESLPRGLHAHCSPRFLVVLSASRSLSRREGLIFLSVKRKPATGLRLVPYDYLSARLQCPGCQYQAPARVLSSQNLNKLGFLSTTLPVELKDSVMLSTVRAIKLLKEPENAGLWTLSCVLRTSIRTAPEGLSLGC